MFRAIYLGRLKALHRTGRLKLDGGGSAGCGAGEFDRLLDGLYRKPWVVYAKAPFGGPRRLVRYLARYVQGVALREERILKVSDSAVWFSYRARNPSRAVRVLKLEGVEFLRRFAEHFLPRGFTRIRFYGFWSASLKGRLLPLIRGLLGPEVPSKPPELNGPSGFSPREPAPVLCPRCRMGVLLPSQWLLPSTGPPCAA